MIKRTFYFFVALFFILFNYSVSDIKTDFFKRTIFFALFISLFFVFRYFNLKRIIRILTVLSSSLIFTYGIIQKYLLFPIYLNNLDAGISTVSEAMVERVKSGRIFSVFSLPTLYTFVCAILLLAIFHYLINSKKNSIKIFWLILFTTGMFNIILTQSFSGILYLLTGFPLYFFLSGRFNSKFFVPLMMILSVFLFIIIGLRFSEAKNLEPIRLRISNWNQAVRIIKTSPLLGIGLGNYESKISGFTYPGEARSIYSHNFILQITSEIGIFFLIIGILLLFLFRKKLYFQINDENALYITALLIVVLYNLIDIGFYFFPASLIFTLIISQIYRKNDPLPKINIILAVSFILIQLLVFTSSSNRKSGSFHMNFKRFDKAELYFKKSLNFNKYNHKSLMGLATTNYAKGDKKNSDRYLGKVLLLNNFNPYANFLKSKISYSEGKYLTSFYYAGRAKSLNIRNREYKKWFDFLKLNLDKNLGNMSPEKK